MLMKQLTGGTVGGANIDPQIISGTSAGFASHTFSDLEVGKKYLVLFCIWSSASLSYNRCDITSITSGDADYELIGHWLGINSGSSTYVGSYYLIEPKTTSITVAHSGTCGYDLIKLD